SIGINVIAKQYTASGLAPGVALPGQSGLRLYGSGFDSNAVVQITGPVYSFAAPSTPLCTGASCPKQQVAATASPDGTALDLSVPGGLASGYYYQVAAFDPTWNASSSAINLEIDPAQATQVGKTQTFSNLATPLFSGQTVSGQFLAGRDPSQAFS